MKPRVLNAWSQVIPVPGAGIVSGAKEARPGVSKICVESTAAPTSVEMSGPVVAAAPIRDTLYRIVLSGVGLTMAEDEILVADGLIRKIRVRKALGPRDSVQEQDRVGLDVVLEYPAKASVSIFPGMPVRTDFEFSREPLSRVFDGKVIAIDPGHGGKDTGVRGPVNLLEKNAALDLALELKAILSSCGATPILSREDDRDVGLRDWILAVSPMQPDALVEIHVAGEKDPMTRKYHVLARRDDNPSFALAGEIAAALTERMGLSFPGTEPADFGVPVYPAVRVEPVCLSHFSDEANFRSPLFRKRTAQAIFNGLSRYFSAAARGGVARAG